MVPLVTVFWWSRSFQKKAPVMKERMITCVVIPVCYEIVQQHP